MLICFHGPGTWSVACYYVENIKIYFDILKYLALFKKDFSRI
jgi:hypothetical protein